MELGFSKAYKSNLPKIDAVMVGRYFASISDIRSSDFCIDKTSSSRDSYGDDAVGYVQLKRDSKLCTVKCKIFSRLEGTNLCKCTLVVDEEDDTVVYIECQYCDSKGGCVHAIAFLMWIHRRSEESDESSECYWKKPRLSYPKYMTVKDMFKCNPTMPNDPSVLIKFLKEGRKRNIQNCGLLKWYQTN